MSLAKRPTTRAEALVLTQNGFRQSPLESGDKCTIDAEDLYIGMWFHTENNNIQLYGPDEALAFLKARFAEHDQGGRCSVGTPDDDEYDRYP